MKFATLQDESRDGWPLLVSRDLTTAAPLNDLQPSLLQILETWETLLPTLEARYAELNAGTLSGSFAFDTNQAAAPLPRAPQWLDASAFLVHGERMVKAFNLSPAGLNLPFPLMYQGMSHDFLGAHAAMPLPSEAHGIDLEGELAVITAEVPMGVTAHDGEARIRLFALVDDVSLRALQPAEMALGFGMIHSKPACVFSPVAVTPDELGAAWKDGRANLKLRVHLNGRLQGELDGGEMDFRFGDLIAHAAKTRTLAAGTVIGSGTFSNRDTSHGTACLAEQRALEMIATGAPATPWLSFGDRIRMEVMDAEGESVFGAIDHTFVQS